jgi:NTE family protein
MKVGADKLGTETDRTQSAKESLSVCAEIQTQPTLGLALSSGGAKALAHIGVIQVLEEHGIHINAIAGCSMGAYVGAVWACGYDGAFMEKLAREVESRWGLLRLIDPMFPPRQGFLRGDRIRERLQASIGDAHFSDLVRPLRIVATNLFTLERRVFESGNIGLAVQASSAIPGICQPVRIHDEFFIDGGISDPLPIDVLRAMGVGRVIAVNTIPSTREMKRRAEIEEERRRHTSLLASAKHLLNQKLNYFAPGNILDVMLRAANAAQMRLAEFSCREADLVLRPVSLDGRWHDFKHPGKYIALGRKAAEAHLEEIKDLLRSTPNESALNKPMAVAA